MRSSKKFYYLVSLPRSGNTVLSSILNQNPEIAVTANSIVPTIMWDLHRKFFENTLLSNFRDEESYKNVMLNIIPNYYSHWSQSHIIDRSTWGSPNNYELLKNFSPNKPKYILLVRDILEILASFIKWSEENKPNFLDYETRNGGVEEKCTFLMRPDLQIVQSYSAVYHIFNKKEENFILIDYKDFVDDPEHQVKKIYSFLGIKSFKHLFVDVEQFSVNGITYSDDALGKNLHKIRTKNIEKQNYEISDFLPKSVIETYKDLNFWSKNN